jgi:hypothetical protein
VARSSLASPSPSTPNGQSVRAERAAATRCTHDGSVAGEAYPEVTPGDTPSHLTVGERLSAAVAGLYFSGAANYNGMVQHGIKLQRYEATGYEYLDEPA